MYLYLSTVFTPVCLYSLTSYNTFMCAYKTAGCQASLCFTVGLITHVTNTIYFCLSTNYRAHLIVHESSSALRIIVCWKHWNKFLCGLSQCGHHELCFDLAWRVDRGCRGRTWTALIQCPLFLHSYFLTFCLTCLSVIQGTQVSLLLVTWESMVKILDQQTHNTHTPCLPCCRNKYVP